MQAVLYMNAEGLTRHYLTCSTPGGRETTSVRTDENPLLAKEMIKRAERIISRDKPPVKLSDDPSHWECKKTPPYFQQCEHYNVCHQNAMPLANCRTCVWSDRHTDGQWLCKKKNIVDPKPCDEHLYIPELMPYELVSYESETESIVYKTKSGKTFKNGPHDEDSYLSKELEQLQDNQIGDIQLAAVRETFCATVESVKDAA